MGGSAPSIPQVNTGALDQTAYNYNTLAGEQTQAGSNVNQVTPFGNLTYTQTGTGPGGIPEYTASTNLSPTTQAQLNLQQQTGINAGTSANKLLAGYNPSNPNAQIGSMTSGLTKEQMNSYLAGMEPFFGYQTEALDSQLANQGLTPGSPAYAQAKNLLEKNQGNVVSSAEAAFEPQAFNQAVQLYGMPVTMAGELSQFNNPESLSQNLINTPTASYSPVNAIGAQQAATQAAYDQAQIQQNQYASQLGGLFGVSVAGIKALPFLRTA